MTVTVAGKNFTQISGCESTSDGGAWVTFDTPDSANVKEGSNSLCGTFKSAGNNDGIFTPTSAVDMSTNTHLRFWLLLTQGSLLNTEASGGIQVGISDGVNTGYYIVGGRDTYPGGWKNYVVDVSRAVDSGTKPTSMNAITSITIRINLTGVGKNVDNTWIDNLSLCDGLIVYGDDAGGYFDFEDIYSVENTPASGGWGVLTKVGGVYYMTGVLETGDSAGTNSCKFNPKDQFVIFEDRGVGSYENIGSSLMGFNIVDNGTGTTEFIFGEKSGTNGISGCVVGVQDVGQGSKYYIDGATDTDVDNFKLYGCTFIEATTSKFPATATNVEILNCNFNACGVVTPSTAKVENCNFISADTDAITVSSATLNVKNCNFIAPTNTAIELTTATTYTFDNLQFSGTNGTSNYDIENTTAGAITVNATNGANPQHVNNSGGGSTTINNAVYLRVYAKDVDGNALSGVQVGIYKTSDDTELMNEDTVATTGLAEQSFNYAADTPIYIRLRKSPSVGTARYFPISTTGTITSAGFTLTAVLTEDDIAVPPISCGWFGGGGTGSYLDVVDRITLADDTVNAIDRCDLTVARRQLAAFADCTYGWFGGGYLGANSDVVDRITLASDTTNAIDRCNLTAASDDPAAFADSTHGWFGGGSFTNVVERITLADDTVNAIDRCDLTVARAYLAAFTDNTHGWFGGGMTSNVVDRITLATDTVNAIDRCDLTAARWGLAGFTDNTHGWFGGGDTGSVSNIVDRITLATDAVNAIDRCDLSVARYWLAAFTDNTHGWFGGGNTGVYSNVVDRITLATDAVNAIDRCDLTVARFSLAAFALT